MNNQRKELDICDEITLDISANYPLQKGIYRFKGCSNYRGIGATGYINFDCLGKSIQHPILIKGNGSFYEVFTIPVMIERITLAIKATEHSSGSFQLQSISIKRINWIQRRIIFQYIAWTTWYRFTKSQRHHYQLFWYTPLFNSLNAFACVQQYRFKFGTISYDRWLEKVDRLSASEAQLIKRFSDRLSERISNKPILLIDSRSCTPLALAATIESVQSSMLQPSAVFVLQKHNHLIALPKISAFLSCIPITLDELTQHITSHFNHHWVWIPAGIRLAPHGLSWITAVIEQDSSLTCIYSDHDFVNDQGTRVDPQFKPDWSEEMAFASGYLGPLLCVDSKSLLDTIEQTDELNCFSLMLYASSQRSSSVKHIPGVLWHLPLVLRDMNSLSVNTLKQFLRKQKRVAKVSEDPISKGLRVDYPAPDPAPLVSIIIPTRDRLDLLLPCVSSILSLTTYSHIEVLVMDNQSQEPETLDYFMRLTSDSRVKVIPFNHPFNYAAINNFAITHARGSVLCFLNNDTEVVTPAWLDEMVSCLYLQRVGAVGAQLRYPNGKLQHAGDLIGGSGCANHLFGPLEPDDLGYMNRVAMRQDVSAVTAACLVTFKEIYQSVGGMDQHNLKVAFNDVDYCLKVGEAGYRVLYTPYAQLIHYESESRGADISSKQRRRGFREAQYMRKRWAAIMMNDPFYNPNLNYYRCDFSLDPSPVIRKPWDA